MGRPLFSASRQPAVRVQPEPQLTPYEKWSYANAFDPDSNEFFESDDAVYEAFIDPGQQLHIPAVRPSTYIVPEPSSSSSEGTSSGRESPMDVVDVDNFEREARLHGMRVLDDTRMPVPTPRNPTIDAQIDAGRALPPHERAQYYLSVIERLEDARLREREEAYERVTRPSVRDRIPTYIDLPPEESRMATPEPVSRAPATPLRPSTPPTRSTPLLVSPSPPPSVTPRLYAWTTFPPATVPPPGSPLTNRGARVSVTRISAPSLVPAHRAA
ncbi:hypothetical protein C8Q70DRAFT_1049775 [Cubamyces menziesii]|uniref:Uncharacterized protein n=1 Tax=Trametes cubensis TaxID=1111947 RepID=A0AAD7TQZ0_9APHY|nr:hypothetical protein C8Q70DRAFT_1049775 [Cubamyces menziesii]KAJ8474449.1 hypothetical protein ONZ51_g7218 [Trametes cubensis]